jgi:aspartyl protease family protein
MFDSIFKSAISIIICGLLMFFAVSNRHTIYEAAGLVPKQAETIVPVQAVASPSSRSTGGAVRIKKNPRDGQFWTDARVNNRSINFLVDTGASTVALTASDAKKAGINLRSLEYNVPVSTAGGQVYAASTTLKSVKVGSIRVKNVRAVVIPEGLHVSLLGMTYLGQIKKIEVTPDALKLKN